METDRTERSPEMNVTHITREFQRMTKAEQARHLREDHGLEITDADVARRAGGRSPAAATFYQRHITAHDEATR